MASNSTPWNFGTSIGERPVAIQIIMPFSCNLLSVSSIFSVTHFFSISISVPSMSKNMILVLSISAPNNF